ncbi:MAG: hypothetical protein ACOY3P_22230 [Planctomycetota bacterium]
MSDHQEMTAEQWTELLRAEEAKRFRNVPPHELWRIIQKTITWAEAQQPVPRNSKARCLELQREKLRRWGELPPDSPPTQ